MKLLDLVAEVISPKVKPIPDYWRVCKNCKFYKNSKCTSYSSSFWDCQVNPENSCIEFKKIKTT